MARERLKGHCKIEVEYDSPVNDPTIEFNWISEFLNIQDIDPKKIMLKKQNPEKLNQLTENYEEVSDLIKNTKFSSYLD